MNNHLTQKLVKRFPVLYQNFYSPMQETCMCWGFEHGDGWFDIIWQLSLAIEDELGYSTWQKRWFLFKRKHFKTWNNLIYKLSPVRHDKRKMIGSGTIGDPYRSVVVEKAKPTWDECIVRTLFGETRKSAVSAFNLPRLGLKKLVCYPYTGFAVDQVKEKFGTLRFYSPGNDRIFKLIRFAEHLSSVTCEICGEPGEQRSDRGWYSTQCDKCHTKIVTNNEPTRMNGQSVDGANG